MTSRTIVTLVLAVVLIGAVLCITGGMSLLGIANNAKFAQTQVWEASFSDSQSMKILDFTGDGQDELFVQNTNQIALFDSAGQELWHENFSGSLLSTTLGDVNGDDVEDIVVFHSSGVTVYLGDGSELWSVSPDDLGSPYRSAVLRFAGGTQVLVGDDSGQVVALDTSGQEVWRGETAIVDYIRGLDDARIDGDPYAAVANHNGLVKLFDEQGNALWEYDLGSDLRRLRAYDLDGDGNSEILIGGDGSRLVALSAVTGEELFAKGLGQTIVEIREAELNGDPGAREFVVGGKDGGVWAFNANGAQLWSSTLSNRVNEIVAIDVDDDGVDEVAVGDDGGGVTLFTGSGARQTLESWNSAIMRLDSGRLTGSDQLVVADASAVHLLDLSKQTAPFFYTPLLAGLIIALVIAFAAWFIATIPPKPVLRVAAEDQSVEGLQSRNRMLHESLADVDRLRGTGEMPANAYLARLRDLRGELADTQAALQKAGQPIQLETFKCPNCGGALPIGLDKCDYCGQTVIR